MKTMTREIPPMAQVIYYVQLAHRALQAGDLGLVRSRLRQIESLQTTFHMDYNHAVCELLEYIKDQLEKEEAKEESLLQ